MDDETPRELDPRYNPMLPAGGDSYIIPKADVLAACEEIAGKQVMAKLIGGPSYEAEFGQAAIPKIAGRPIEIRYADGADGGPELLIDGKSLNVIDGEEAAAIVYAGAALKSAIEREEARKKYLTPEGNRFIKIPD